MACSIVRHVRDTSARGSWQFGRVALERIQEAGWLVSCAKALCRQAHVAGPTELGSRCGKLLLIHCCVNATACWPFAARSTAVHTGAISLISFANCSWKPSVPSGRSMCGPIYLPAVCQRQNDAAQCCPATSPKAIQPTTRASKGSRLNLSMYTTRQKLTA